MPREIILWVTNSLLQYLTEDRRKAVKRRYFFVDPPLLGVPSSMQSMEPAMSNAISTLIE
ncbi:hypothetical protein BHE74_00024863 [Ensete ventricosum]|nr:hypothetical protein GW17_00009485 [Ensete ventricosum]RWW67672.1 hypothetical protein BHE74_00024863 [Ensete ventricosum]RZS00765.1 hypothetical protein BHM03_00030544 [Ensete ventricosum]